MKRENPSEQTRDSESNVFSLYLAVKVPRPRERPLADVLKASWTQTGLWADTKL